MLCGMLVLMPAEHTFLYPLQSICLSKWGVKKLGEKHFEFMHRGDSPTQRGGFFFHSRQGGGGTLGSPPGTSFRATWEGSFRGAPRALEAPFICRQKRKKWRNGLTRPEVHG